MFDQIDFFSWSSVAGLRRETGFRSSESGHHHHEVMNLSINYSNVLGGGGLVLFALFQGWHFLSQLFQFLSSTRFLLIIILYLKFPLTDLVLGKNVQGKVPAPVLNIKLSPPKYIKFMDANSKIIYKVLISIIKENFTGKMYLFSSLIPEIVFAKIQETAPLYKGMIRPC